MGIAVLNKAGQSIWYDNLSRSVLRSGELKKVIDCGVSGLTSNPTIFKKAIADTEDYTGDIKKLASLGLSAEQIAEELMIADIKEAADLLLPIYEKTNCTDGFVSLEVSPNLAYDTNGTVEAAKKLWQKVNRKNLMIKIPATAEGVSAIKQALSKGINVNITLIFSTKRYQEVAKCYLEALTNLNGKSNTIASVASFFVSRLDSIVEKDFSARGIDLKTFLGKIGIANCVQAYKLFEEIFSEQSFQKFSQSGYRKQKVLWASTSAKNPDFDSLIYVKNLVAPYTINTLPPETIKLMQNNFEIGKLLPECYQVAEKTLSEFKNAGGDLEKLCAELEAQGVAAFKDSYDQVVTAVGKRM